MTKPKPKGQPKKIRSNKGSNAKDGPWTDGDVDLIKDLRLKGWTAGDLERHPTLSGRFTRSSIMSKFDRLGLLGKRKERRPATKAEANNILQLSTRVDASEIDMDRPFVPIWRISPNLEKDIEDEIRRTIYG